MVRAGGGAGHRFDDAELRCAVHVEAVFAADQARLTSDARVLDVMWFEATRRAWAPSDRTTMRAFALVTDAIRPRYEVAAASNLAPYIDMWIERADSFDAWLAGRP